jgi:SNARE protein
MSNQELINAGTKTMDEIDQAIERTKKVNSFWNMN